MNNFREKCLPGGQLHHLIKAGLIRELFQRQQITQTQFERLMRLQRT